MLANMIDEGFVAVQALSIRRLMESSKKNAARQVVSLRRVIDEICASRPLITREMYVAHDGLPYDPEPARRAFYEKLHDSDVGVRVDWLSMDGPTAWSAAMRMHESFDRLSKKAAGERARDDLIDIEMFDRLECLVSSSRWQDIVEFTNKYVAHAADLHSRSTLMEKQHGFSLNTLEACHEGICRAFEMITGPILWEGSFISLPVPNYRHLDDLKKPCLSHEDLERLSAFWDGHIKRIDSWRERDLFEE